MPEADFPDFELVPDEALALTPDEEAALLADPEDAALTTPDTTLPLGRTVFMDWDAGQLRATEWVSGVDAVVWILQCALNTARGALPILPDSFGRSGEYLLGGADGPEARALHETDIRDTLLSAHERVTDVTGFRWIVDPDVPGERIDFEADVEIDGQVVTLVGGSLDVRP